MSNLHRSAPAAALLATLLVGLAPALARADRVSVKGVVLEGKVKAIGAKEIVMETVYGKGDLTIAVADVEAIETEAPFHLFHGDDVETVGVVVGLSPEAVRLVGADAVPVEVPFAEVYVARRDPGPDAGLFERASLELPFWSGFFDLAFSTTQATDDTLGLATSVGLRREHGPSRLKLGAGYRLGKEKKDGEGQNTTENEIRGFLRQEYDLTKRVFAYVYERFFGGDTNDYPGMAFGAESDWKLPWLGAVWHNRLDYTPSFEDWLGDYLLRYETGFLIPMTSAISFKLALVDSYDSTPADGNERNSLATLVGLSLGF